MQTNDNLQITPLEIHFNENITGTYQYSLINFYVNLSSVFLPPFYQEKMS